MSYVDSQLLPNETVLYRARLHRSLYAAFFGFGALTLAAAALVALALAAVGLWVAVASELRDERAELFDLEAQGVGPNTLRAQFRARAAALVVVGAAGGTVFALFEPFKGEGSGRVRVTIPNGATARDIGDLLEQRGVVSNGRLFALRAAILTPEELDEALTS